MKRDGRNSSVVLNQLYFDPSTFKWTQHRPDTQPPLVPAKELVVLCAEVAFNNLDQLVRCVEQHRPFFICTRNITRALYDAVCGLNVVRHNYAVCQHNASQQCVLFWHHSLNVDFVSMRTNPVTCTALTIRQMRGVRCSLNVLCASPASGNTIKGIADILHDYPQQQGNQPCAVIAIVPKGQDIKNVALQAEYQNMWGSSESPFQIVVKGCINGEHVMGLPTEYCSAVVATMSINPNAPYQSNQNQNYNVRKQQQNAQDTRPQPWSTDRTIILQNTLSPTELVLDITGAVSGLHDAVEALNTGRIPWNHEYAVCVGTNKGETFPAFVLVASTAQCDISSFRSYVTKLNHSRGSNASAAAAPAVVQKPAQRWSVTSSIPLTSVSPVDASYDLSAALPNAVVPYTLAQIVSRLNAFEVEWKKDYAVAYVADGDNYVLLAAANVPCDISAARHEALAAATQPPPTTPPTPLKV